MASVGGYAYAVEDDRLFVNLYAEGEAKATVGGNEVTVVQKTRYPWSGDVKFTLNPKKAGRFDLSLRIPGWVKGKPVPSDLYRYEDASPAEWTIKVNGKPVSPELVDGYAGLDREWKSGDVVELQLGMPVRRVACHPAVTTNEGLVALERGPVVYAFEGVDNKGSVFDIALPPSSKVTPSYKEDLLGGVVVLGVEGAKRVARKDGKIVETSAQATAIPYAVWNNRGNSPMSVWLGRDTGHVRPALEPTFTSQAKVSVSFARRGMDPKRLNDQQMPRNATDGFASAFDFWPHLGGSEWITYEFNEAAEVSGVTVSWFDDTGKGGACALPESWRLSFRDAEGNWQPVEKSSRYSIRKAEPVVVTFQAVKTDALRLDLELKEGRSAGLYEWQVESP